MRAQSEPDERLKRREEDGAPDGLHSPDLEGGDRSMEPESMTLDDLAEAEAARPTLPDETEDGLDELEESVRHEAEDRPADARGGFDG